MADPLLVYERGCADERARIVWWLRAAADGPASVSRPDEARFAADLADVIDAHPDRFADAPPARPRDRLDAALLGENGDWR